MSRPHSKTRTALVALPFVMATAVATSAWAEDSSWYAGGQGSAVFQGDADADLTARASAALRQRHAVGRRRIRNIGRRKGRDANALVEETTVGS